MIYYLCFCLATTILALFQTYGFRRELMELYSEEEVRNTQSTLWWFLGTFFTTMVAAPVMFFSEIFLLQRYKELYMLEFIKSIEDGR